ncbi:phosphotransferase [Williamsoniiplasma lucivorax]|uniref:Choline kinase n=1 Tax=Williamsoniiplasma lucivorax TaxID=209274 RepID=A0A2S5RDZ9_9MOLU|nr:phosphotransferase [Williamsoniiplasma lucivorax]PPE05518.1 choline kinase [Williamsoniiplasma lucivorax]
MYQIKPSGLTNKIIVKKKKFIKKSNRQVDYFLDRQNENHFYQQVQNVVFILVPTKIIKKWNYWISQMPYYPNTKTLDIQTLNEQGMEKVIDLIKQLHAQKLDLKLFDPQAFLELFTNKVGVIEQLKPWTAKIDAIIKNYYDDVSPVVSHNDLIPENFLIKDQQMYLIDFEYVSLNHYLFDYASFMTESLKKEQNPTFLKLLNLNNQELIKLTELMQYQNYLWAHWAKYMYQNSKNEIFLAIMENKIARLN